MDFSGPQQEPVPEIAIAGNVEKPGTELVASLSQSTAYLLQLSTFLYNFTVSFLQGNPAAELEKYRSQSVQTA